MTKVNYHNTKIRKFLTGLTGLTGFTLIEMLVALAIFSIVVTVMLSVTISLVKVQRKTQNLQLVHDSARYAIEMMAKEIRMSKIIEVKKTPDPNPNMVYDLKIHRLDDPDPNNWIIYHFYNQKLTKEGILARDKGSSVRNLNDENKVFIKGYFYPVSDSPGKRLTIVLTATSVGARPGEEATIDLQTTVISRDYGS